MLSATDLSTVYEFVKTTGEGNIRNMMTGPKMTAVHVGLLLKIIRGTTAADFGKYCESNTFPRIKFSSNEEALKETFWNTACNTFVQLGLVSAGAKAA